MLKSETIPVKCSRSELLRQRADLGRKIADIDAQLADLEARTPADEFSSVDLPPGVSRRAFREAASLIVGAYREGHVWHVSREAWFAARAKPARRAAAVALVTPNDDDVDEILRGGGLRIVRRSA